jgi:hypothetical protein
MSITGLPAGRQRRPVLVTLRPAPRFALCRLSQQCVSHPAHRDVPRPCGVRNSILRFVEFVLPVTSPSAPMVDPPGIRASTGGSNMRTVNSSLSKTALSVIAGAFALLVAPACASAQANAPVPVTQASPPKQVGLWMVNAWVRGNVGSHCSAERPLPGATGSGGTLQFVLVRYPGGYRIALAAEEWDLKPQSAFPVEINAQPVMRSDANAVAITPKLVVIDLGADGKFMQKLAGAPMIEIKTAQAVFKLPLEGFANALSEVDSCYGTLRKAVSNPFAAPKTASAK